MLSLPFTFALLAGIATYAGGKLTMRFSDHRGAIFGLTAGLMIGLALLDLLPEAVEVGSPHYGAAGVLAVAATGLVAYFLLFRLSAGGNVGRLVLLSHGLIDGLGIGLAFQVSASTGLLVAVAILVHKVADGANMVGMTMALADARRAHAWLAVNALVPLLGLMLGKTVQIEPSQFALILALFAGGFLYIGVVELLPQSRVTRGWQSSAATLVGLAVMSGVAQFAR